MTQGEDLKLFHLNHTLLRTDLDTISQVYGLDDLHDSEAAVEESRNVAYAQFDAAVRREAAAMALHYESFYCLENSIRQSVGSTLLAAEGEGWWDKCVPEFVRKHVADTIAKEREAAVTIRSADSIDYTTFGELSQIIDSNWVHFSDTFNDRKAVQRVLAGLNLLRGPIAHCSPLATDEEVRLELALRDWFRLMS